MKVLGSSPPMRAVLLLLFVPACAHPVADLWPPRAGEPTHRVVVATDDWHSTIAVRQPGGDYEEWGYADMAYYLEEDNDFLGTLSALFVPSAGVVHVTRCDGPRCERFPEPAIKSWTFEVSERGRERLVAYLHAEIADWTPIANRGGALWYTARTAYNISHDCHYWTASALREAGLPMSPALSLFLWSLEAQLDRAAEMATVTAE
jgi:hypothetical protein